VLSGAEQQITQEKVKLVLYTGILLYRFYSVFIGCGRPEAEVVIMATRRLAARARRGRNNKTRSEEHVYGVAVSRGFARSHRE